MTSHKIIIMLAVLVAILLALHLLGFFHADDDQSPDTQPTINGTS